MKEQLPSPQFNQGQYERPNQKWVCGQAAEGKPCRIGPNAKGRCRATFECQPALEIKPGETKGRYRCTRTAEYGGPCEVGPTPQGACSRPIPKCVPVRSLRVQRKHFTISTIAFTAGVLLVGLCGPFRTQFIRPGKLSLQHATSTFARLAGTRTNSAGGCRVCHQQAHAGLSGWIAAAFSAAPGPFEFRSFAATHPVSMTSIDQNCQRCHPAHSLHQPNVPRDHSCSACHVEHRGARSMEPPTDASCLACHASAEVMEASFQIGKTLPASAYDYRPEQGRVLFKTSRPERGYTRVIHGFALDHPEFQAISAKLQDPDPLKFNHQLHLGNVFSTKGQKLVCADCHKPDAAGVYHLKITYQENCKSCHSLQFDIQNPDLVVPHGNTAHVRDYLRSLPQQYADYGATKKGITGRRELEVFVQEQMKHLRAEAGSGEDLEQRVFFSDARTGPVVKIGQMGAIGAAQFPGCAFCHEVTASATGVPQIAKSVIPDRWLIRSRFDHSKHFQIDCVTCHNAEHSRQTADVLLPSKRTCAVCHSPRGGAPHHCSSCHAYHAPRKEIALPAP